MLWVRTTIYSKRTAHLHQHLLDALRRSASRHLRYSALSAESCYRKSLSLSSSHHHHPLPKSPTSLHPRHINPTQIQPHTTATTMPPKKKTTGGSATTTGETTVRHPPQLARSHPLITLPRNSAGPQKTTARYAQSTPKISRRTNKHHSSSSSASAAPPPPPTTSGSSPPCPVSARSLVPYAFCPISAPPAYRFFAMPKPTPTSPRCRATPSFPSPRSHQTRHAPY